MRGDFASISLTRLQWLPELQLGFLDIDPPSGLYGPGYFLHYLEMDCSPMGERLTEVRVDMVKRHWPGAIVDVGIGGGAFLRAHGDARGWDVNPEAIAWLFDRGALIDPRSCEVDAVTMWDSMEHMRNPSEILRNVRKYVFVSTPIYADAAHCMRSKHFKPGEHLWYFTERGLIEFMLRQGFRVVELNWLESELGREDIGSYAFERM